MLELEKIRIKEVWKSNTKNFIPLTYLDFPVELISDDGSVYLLWIKDLENKEIWYVVFTDSKEILKYLKGEISARDLIEKGKVYVGERNYENYYEIKNLTSLEFAIKKGLVNSLPTFDAKIKLDEDFYKEIEILIYQNLKKQQVENDLKNIEKFNVNPLHLRTKFIYLAI
jgi:hypothetical protein